MSQRYPADVTSFPLLEVPLSLAETLATLENLSSSEPNTLEPAQPVRSNDTKQSSAINHQSIIFCALFRSLVYLMLHRSHFKNNQGKLVFEFTASSNRCVFKHAIVTDDLFFSYCFCFVLFFVCLKENELELMSTPSMHRLLISPGFYEMRCFFACFLVGT